jgi:hypothetical protein
MNWPQPLGPDPTNRPTPLERRAIDNLRFIRETMERAGAFTAVPGWGSVLIGLTALGAAAIAAPRATWVAWLAVWLVEALVALAIALAAMGRKARRSGVPLWSGPGRRVALGVVPAFAACLPLTVALAGAGRFDLLPGTWLLLYGCAVVAGGAHSVAAVPLMGGSAMLLGTVALFAPGGWEDWWMAGGFGGVHLVFGAVIARRYGG